MYGYSDLIPVDLENEEITITPQQQKSAIASVAKAPRLDDLDAEKIGDVNYLFAIFSPKFDFRKINLVGY